MKIDIVDNNIIKAAEEGLLSEQKSLPSWLFYDEKGDLIFQEIMHMPSYYLTPSEFEILSMNKADILNQFSKHGPFYLIELGAGNGLKTEVLLKYFVEQEAEFSYHPIDISASVLDQLQNRVKKSVPDLNYYPQQGEYIQALREVNWAKHQRKVILFLGANIGNFSHKRAGQFLSEICDVLNTNDLVFLGVDLKKDPRMIQRAYDDPYGITKRFNLNLLVRLNTELGANFRVDNFDHYATYIPDTGEVKSYLISLTDQDVYIGALNRSIRFNQWEHIHTEVSMKYDQRMIERLAAASGLQITRQYLDCKQYFSDVVFVKP